MIIAAVLALAAQDMADTARKIEEGVAAYIKGTDPKEAFQPFGVKVKDGLLESLKNAKVDAVTCLGWEVELTYHAKDTPAYRFRTFVILTKEGAGFLELKGQALQPDESAGTDAAVSSLPENFQARVKAMDELFRKGDASTFVWADPAKCCVGLPDEIVKEAEGEIAKSKKKLEAALAEFRKLDVGSIRVRIDDIAMVAWSEGKAVGILDAQ